MLQALMNLLSLCFRPFGHNSNLESVGGGVSKEGKEGLLWYKDIGRYGSGDFSMAVVQANQVLEDQSQIEFGALGTFIGVYDGHGGPQAARYVCDHLFKGIFQRWKDLLGYLGLFSRLSQWCQEGKWNMMYFLKL